MCPNIYPELEKDYVDAFFSIFISVKWNVSSLMQDSNSSRQANFQRR